MRTRLFLVVALLVASVGALFQSAAPAGASTLTVVTRNNVGGSNAWQETVNGTASASFPTGVGSPVGRGAYEVTTGPGTASAGGTGLLANTSYSGTKIADLSTLTYYTYLGFENPSGTQVAPVVRIPVDTKVDNGSGGTIQTTLFFEPYYSTVAFGGTQHNLAKGTWQGWDALAGRWWSNTTVKPICATNCFVTWADVLAAMPNATITAGGVGIFAGDSSPAGIGPWHNVRAMFDNLTVGIGANSATYDFEPAGLTTRFSSLQGWSAETQGAPGITFDDGPDTPPLGNGSLRFANVDASSRADLINKGWNGSKVSDISELSYNTWVTQGGTSGSVAPYLHLDCQACGVNGINGSLVFEPVYQGLQYGNGGQSPLQLNKWQHWDARTGLWWLAQTGQPFQLQSLDAWESQYPLMTLTGFHVGADGREPWTGFDGAVDGLNIRIKGAEATFDFDPEKPTITSFSPTSGPAGTIVTINGSHFAGTTAVKFNGLNAAFTVNNPTTITATVPAGATTGVITVATGAGTLISSSNFVTGADGLVRYEETNPSFDFSQTAGWVVLNDANESGGRALMNPNNGSKVDIGFTGSTIHWVGLRGPNTAIATVSVDNGPITTVDTYAPVYEPQQVLFSQASGITPGVHTLHIAYSGTNPSAASTSYLVVDAIETQQFTPSISGFTPASGPPGSTVTISGAHLDGASEVRFNATLAPSFAVNSPSSVTATVPSGATSGPISIKVGSQTATSAGSFTVESAPVVTLERHEAESDPIFDYSKSSGWFRWNDTSTGNGESGGAAMLNSASGSFVDVNFNGPAVKWIGLKGPNTAIGLVSIDGVSYGSVDTYAAAYTSQQVLFSKLDLAPGAHTLRLTLTGKNAAAASTSYLVVDAVDTAQPAGVITKFSPVGGPVGTTVTITGSNLSGTTAVKFNGVPATFQNVSATQLTAAVPAGATSGVLTVVGPGGSSNSLSQFTVTVSTVLNRFEETTSAFAFGANQGWATLSDTSAGGGESGGTAMYSPNAGASVDVTFDGDIVNLIGLKGPNTAIASITIDNGPATRVDTYAASYKAQQVVFSKTGLASGTHVMRVTYAGTNPSATSTSYLVVDAVEAQPISPSITGFTPASGPPGATVTITGSHLDGASEVRFNGTTATFAVNSASSVTATVPSGATTGPISIKVGTQTATSAASFTVEAAPTITLQRHEAESDSIFDYSKSSGWFRWNDTTTAGGESGGAAMLNSSSGSFVDVTFNGPAVNWIGLKGPNTAIGLVSIDGVSYGSVDTYAPAYSAQLVLFSKADLPSGPHTLRLSYAGKNAAAAATSYVVVDAVDTAQPAGAITKFSPVGGPVGTTVTITGTNLNDTTAVKFNGTPAASFTKVSATQLTAVVPPTATSGVITVVSPSGASNSVSQFTVTLSTVLNRYEETASAFAFGANQGWATLSDTTAGGGESGGTAMYSPNAGSSVDVTFTGDTINLVGLKGPNTAIASISIDNVSYGTVDTYAAAYKAQQVLFSKTGLAPGSHVMRVTYVGQNASAASTSYLVVDAVEAAGIS